LAFDKSNADEPKQQNESEGSSNEPQKKQHRGDKVPQKEWNTVMPSWRQSSTSFARK